MHGDQKKYIELIIYLYAFKDYLNPKIILGKMHALKAHYIFVYKLQDTLDAQSIMMRIINQEIK